MSVTNNVGYCNRCEQNVLLRRKEFDVCLAIILVIFTAGIGLIIYWAYYHSKPPDRCVHCSSICFPQPNRQNNDDRSQSRPVEPKNPYIVQNQEPRVATIPQNFNEEVPPDEALPEAGYCGFCGEQVAPGIKFCPSCGTKQ